MENSHSVNVSLIFVLQTHTVRKSSVTTEQIMLQFILYSILVLVLASNSYENKICKDYMSCLVL